MKRLISLFLLTIILGLLALIIRVPKERKNQSSQEFASYCNQSGIASLGQRIKARQNGHCKG